jgi:hypothetical protein
LGFGVWFVGDGVMGWGGFGLKNVMDLGGF